MTTWYTSDQHFGHLNIITYCERPFYGVDHMTEMLIANHNEVVQPEDYVYMLGDFSLNANMLKHVPRLNGHKILLAGNHDKCWAGMGSKSKKFIQQYEDAGFEMVDCSGAPWTHLIQDDDRSCVVNMSHFPYSGDSHDGDRFEAYRPADDGKIVVHGHVHNAWKVRGRQVNVGVDMWNYYPVDSATLLNTIEKIGDGFVTTK